MKERESKILDSPVLSGIKLSELVTMAQNSESQDFGAWKEL